MNYSHSDVASHRRWFASKAVPMREPPVSQKVYVICHTCLQADSKLFWCVLWARWLKTLTLIAVRRTETCGPQLAAEWNSNKCCTICTYAVWCERRVRVLDTRLGEPQSQFWLGEISLSPASKRTQVILPAVHGRPNFRTPWSSLETENVLQSTIVHNILIWGQLGKQYMKWHHNVKPYKVTIGSSRFSLG
jgi:hypothetical protein